MRKTAIFLTLFIANAAIAAPGEDHWGDPTERAEIHQSLTDARTLIENGDPASAITALTPLTLSHSQEADVFNLLGFARRKTGDLKGSAWAYSRALQLDPDHLGALEYQGELFLSLGRPKLAEDNLARLTMLCGIDCEEREDLAEAITDWRATR